MQLEIDYEKSENQNNTALFDKNFERNFNIDSIEKEIIRKGLVKTYGSIAKTAELLGISRTTLWRKMKKYNISVPK